MHWKLAQCFQAKSVESLSFLPGGVSTLPTQMKELSSRFDIESINIT